MMTGRCFSDLGTTVVAILAVLVVLSHHAAAEHLDSRKLLQESGIERGIIVQLGCGDPQRCLDLHADGQYVVQALDREPEKVAAARKQVQSEGCGCLSLGPRRGRQGTDNPGAHAVRNGPMRSSAVGVIRLETENRIANCRQTNIG